MDADRQDARSAATTEFSGLRRDTPVVLVAKTPRDAADLLAELADDPRVAMCHIDLGNGQYIVPDRSNRG